MLADFPSARVPSYPHTIDVVPERSGFSFLVMVKPSVLVMTESAGHWGLPAVGPPAAVVAGPGAGGPAGGDPSAVDDPQPVRGRARAGRGARWNACAEFLSSMGAGRRYGPAAARDHVRPETFTGETSGGIDAPFTFGADSTVEAAGALRSVSTRERTAISAYSHPPPAGVP